ncbi:MAG TPA: hypothetical protein VFM79_05930 [Pelobium sp.]|nr:hypothetical protein [Pelobium sp.]
MVKGFIIDYANYNNYDTKHIKIILLCDALIVTHIQIEKYKSYKGWNSRKYIKAQTL